MKFGHWKATCPRCGLKTDSKEYTCPNCGAGEIGGNFGYGQKWYGCNQCGEQLEDPKCKSCGAWIGKVAKMKLF
jgi:hypothetical protein